MNSRIHVVGKGIVCAIGRNYSECLESLQREKHGIRPLSSLSSIHSAVLPVGEVSVTNAALAHQLGLTKTVTRTALLGSYAVREALESSGLQDVSRWRTGLLSGTTVGGMDRTEFFIRDFLKDPAGGNLADVVLHGCGAVTEYIAEIHGIKDFVTTINTACSSSVNAILLAARMIRHGMLDLAIAGGTDALTRFTINGFNSLMILDKDLCRPFDANRNGINLGEGAGYLVLASERVVREEKMKPGIFINGFANTNDAFHQTASSPDGRGSYASMQKALTMARLRSDDISYINLHGTGTQNNDLSEGKAIHRLFGDSIPPLSSTKSLTGHTLGASGGIESVFSLMALEHQCLLPNLRFETPMPEAPLTPVLKFRQHPVRHVMNNAFGFGGTCASVIFSMTPV